MFAALWDSPCPKVSLPPARFTLSIRRLTDSMAGPLARFSLREEQDGPEYCPESFSGSLTARIGRSNIPKKKDTAFCLFVQLQEVT